MEALGLDALVEYDWELALGDHVIRREEFEKLAELKTPLVRVRGQWIELSPERVEEALKIWNQSQGQMALGEILRMNASVQRQPGQVSIYEGSLPVIDIEGEGWVADLLERLGGKAKLEELASICNVPVRTGLYPASTLRQSFTSSERGSTRTLFCCFTCGDELVN